MSRRTRAGLAVAGLLACLIAVPVVSAAVVPSLAAPATEQTMPSVSPKRGGRRTVFTVSFTAREATAPAMGTTQTAARYEVMAVRRGSSQPTSCTTMVTRDVGAVTPGRRVRVRLVAPRPWCVGHYRATVVLQRQVVCTQPQGEPPVACPALAFAPVDTGHVAFVVRSPR